VVSLLFEISITEPWSEIHKLINSILNKVELPDQWKKSTIVQTHKKGSKTDCSNYHGISQLSTSYQILSNIFISRLSPQMKITGDHQH
jgi:hypothetical protein